MAMLDTGVGDGTTDGVGDIAEADPPGVEVGGVGSKWTLTAGGGDMELRSTTDRTHVLPSVQFGRVLPSVLHADSCDA